MNSLFTQQNAIIAIGVLLLAAPVIAKVTAMWIASLVSTAPKKDFEIDTVVQLMQLRNDLDHQGAKNASSICRDLVFAIVYGDEKRGPKE
jgi:hypothetical protein